MSVVVSALGPSLDDQVDERFGRARYLLLVDDDLETIVDAGDNSENNQALQGAGIGAAERVGSKGASAVITGHLGPKAFQALQVAGVTGYDGSGRSVREALAAFKEGRLAELGQTEAHRGLD